MKTLILSLLILTSLVGYNQECYYTLTLKDNGYDGWYDKYGWNNGVIDISINGELMYDNLCITNELESLHLVVSNGDILTIYYKSLCGISNAG